MIYNIFSRNAYKKVVASIIFVSGIFSTILSANEANVKSASEFMNALYKQDRAVLTRLFGDTYTQHNQHYKDGKEALLAALQYFDGKVKIHRIFADGEFVVVHNEFSEGRGTEKVEGVGFDIFRFHNGKIVEHWDNLATKLPPNPSGRKQTDGTTKIDTKADSKASKKIVESFVKDVLMGQNPDKLASYFDNGKYIQHNASIADGLSGLGQALESMAKNGLVMKYHKIHKILGSGDFVLSISEGEFGKADSKGNAPKVAFYDLFRVKNGKIAEHWDIIEPILSEDKAQNRNTKFGF